MKGKYMTTQIMLACLSKPARVRKDIHTLLQETIAERKRIMQRLENMAQHGKVVGLYLVTRRTA